MTDRKRLFRFYISQKKKRQAARAEQASQSHIKACFHDTEAIVTIALSITLTGFAVRETGVALIVPPDGYFDRGTVSLNTDAYF